MGTLLVVVNNGDALKKFIKVRSKSVFIAKHF